MIYDLVFLFLVLSVCIDAVRYHRYRPFREAFTPLYSLAMCIYTVYDKWQDSNWILLFIVLVFGILIGSLQCAKSEVQYREKEEGQKLRPYVKDHFPYILGWLALVAVGLILYFLIHHILPSSVEDVHRAALRMYQSSQTWYMWALYAAAGLTYYVQVDRLVRKNDPEQDPPT